MTELSGTGTPGTSAATEPTLAQIVTSIRLALNGTLGMGGVQDYEIAGKKISRYSFRELIDADKHYSGLIVAQSFGTEATLAKFSRETR